MRSTLRCWTAVLIGAAGLCAAPRPSAACVGDCNGNARVTVDELVRGVSISLETGAIDACDAIDNNRDGLVTVNELVRAVNKSLTGCALGAPGESLLSTQGDQLDEYDIGSGASVTAVPSSHASVTGQACRLTGGSGNYAVGEITGWPEQVTGVGIFSPDGTFLQKLPLPTAEGILPSIPVGCAVDAQGRIFASSVGPTFCDGQLVVFFPPDYAQSCIIDNALCQGSMMALDDAGDLYVATQAGVSRYTGPFPSSAAECGSVVPSSRVFIDNPENVVARGVARGRDGHFFVSQGGDPDVASTAIQEFDAQGVFVRDLLPSGFWGNPAGLVFDADGSLYYADRGLDAVGAPIPDAATVRKIGFADDGTAAEPELVATGLTAAAGLGVFPSRADEWLTLGGSYRRTYFNPRERVLTTATAPDLVVKWRYLTGGMISAQAAVTWIDIPGEGRTQIVIVSSWDRYVYALRAENGSRVWSYQRKPQPGTFYPFAGSATVAWVGDQQRVYVPGGETMYCLDATTGAEIWQFDAGTGCTTCTPRQERNQIESTPAVVNGLVITGMDVNDSAPGKGGVLALRADDGRLAWWFDLETEATCRPLPEDNVRRFDGYHSEAELGLNEGFLASRPGCDFDRTSTACGNVWSSPAVDFRRGLFYIGSSNCDTDDDPSTPPPPPPMPPYDEAIFAVDFDGNPAWVWRPREVDNDDLSFGAVPNLFEATIGGAVRAVVGIGGKDGTYYVLDRDGVNEITGVIEPYWQTNVVPGGPAGGMIGAASVGENRIAVCTAPGFSVFDPQKPTVHTFDAGTGEVAWQFGNTDPCFGPTMGVPGLVLTGGTPRPNVNVFDREDGRLVRSLPGTTVISGLASGPAIVGGTIYVGGGTGAFNEGSDAEAQARQDTPLSAMCTRGAAGCTPNTCNDGNACTYDYRDRAGNCVSENSAEDLECSSGGAEGVCRSGVCVVVE